MANEITVTFPRLNQFWNDSGVVGLYQVIVGQVYAPKSEDSPDSKERLDVQCGVTAYLTSESLAVIGEARAIEELLKHAYSALVSRYYNISTKV